MGESWEKSDIPGREMGRALCTQGLESQRVDNPFQSVDSLMIPEETHLKAVPN